MSRAIPFVSAVAIVCVMSASARADVPVMLENLTTGATVFNDSFEGGTVGSDPTATTGTWGSTYATNGSAAVVADMVNMGFPAAEGGKFFRIHSPNGNSAFYKVGAGVSANSGAGDIIRLTISFSIASGQEQSIYLQNSDGTVLLQLGLWGPSYGTNPNAVYVMSSGGWVPTGLYQEPYIWNTLTVTHKNGTTDWAISVNGGSPYYATGYSAGTSKTWTDIKFQTDSAPVCAYFDAGRTASAVSYGKLMQNVTTGAVILHDGFEGVAVGADPVAITGTWGSLNGTGATAAVIDPASTGIPASEGNQFLKIQSPSGVAGSKVFSGVSANSGSGNVIRLAFAFRVTAGMEESLYLQSSDGTDLLQLGFWGYESTGSGATGPCKVSVVSSDGSAWVDMGSAFAADPTAWNTLVVTHTNGTTAWQISVNGSSAYNATGYSAGTSKTWTGIKFATDSAPVTFCMDSLGPEKFDLSYEKILRNISTGATVFDDSFEAGTVASAPSATTGTWGNTYGNNGSSALVTSTAYEGRYSSEGDKYLKINSPYSDSSFYKVGAGVSANSGAGEIVQMRLAFRVASGMEQSVYLRNSDGTDLLQVGIFGPSSPGSGATSPNLVSVVSSDGSTWVSTGYNHDPDNWNILTITHTNGTTDWAISVNDQTPYYATGYSAGTSKTWTDIKFQTDLAPVCAYFDRVADISHGRQVILNRGIQVQGFANNLDSTDYGNGTYTRWKNSKFNTLNVTHQKPNLTLMANMPSGTTWGRMVPTPSSTDPDLNYVYLLEAEKPYADNLVSSQYYEEDPDHQVLTFHRMAETSVVYRAWNCLYPNMLVHSNFTGAIGLDPSTYNELETIVSNTHPDMVLFNIYPLIEFPVEEVDDPPEHPRLGMERNNWYTVMQRYRTAALVGWDGSGLRPIVYGQYLRGYRTSYTSDLPSESYIRLMYFASLTFGFTYFDTYVYNESGGGGVTPMLFASQGEGTTTPVYNYFATANQQVINLGPALIRLKSTDIRMIPGSGKTVDSTGLSAWSTGAGGDSSITAIAPRGTGNTSNPATYCDWLIGYFRPLKTNNSDYPYANGMHFMVCNGKVGQPTAYNAAGRPASEQEEYIRIDFNFGSSGYNCLQRYSRTTGQEEFVELVAGQGTEVGWHHVTGSQYYLILRLDGGTADLFRFFSQQ